MFRAAAGADNWPTRSEGDDDDDDNGSNNNAIYNNDNMNNSTNNDNHNNTNNHLKLVHKPQSVGPRPLVTQANTYRMWSHSDAEQTHMILDASFSTHCISEPVSLVMLGCQTYFACSYQRQEHSTDTTTSRMASHRGTHVCMLTQSEPAFWPYDCECETPRAGAPWREWQPEAQRKLKSSTGNQFQMLISTRP